MMRKDGRAADALRALEIEVGFSRTASGSALIRCGGTRVLCTAMVEKGVPPFLRDSGKGWVTAEYAMLPSSTQTRKRRAEGGKVDGRSVEIQRLIGRSMRAIVDLYALDGYTIHLDCDVIEADGGTRTASITGAFVALCQAVAGMLEKGQIRRSPVIQAAAAISVGVVHNQPVLDLCYVEDSSAQVDMNVVMTECGSFIEIQGTGEERPFPADELASMLLLARKGVAQLIAAQRTALGVYAHVIGSGYHPGTLVAATKNAGKLAEIRQILGSRFGKILSMQEVCPELEVGEDGKTFEENAVKKAEAVMRRTGCAALADDSGLCVDALGGAPGVYSARYAQMERPQGWAEDEADALNNVLLLEKLEKTLAPRTASFVAAVALARPGEDTLTATGACEGEIGFGAKGEGGFGYDPLFVIPALGKTFAELAAEEKNALSHRGKALETLVAKLKDD